MRRPLQSGILFVALVSLLCSAFIAQGEEPTEQKAVAPADIEGMWYGGNVQIAAGDAEPMDVDSNGNNIVALISDKTLTLCVGDTVISEMSYVLDTKQTPWTIDTKSPDGEMLGIARVKGRVLEIRFNDAEDGRPESFGDESGLTLKLNRAHQERLYAIESDGTGLREVFKSPKLLHIGGPSCSPDGKQLAFDGWGMNEDYNATHMYVVNTDGSGLKDLGIGAMPGWSPDGAKINHSLPGGAEGIFIMNADGSSARKIEAEGWCSRWSPKNADEIACKPRTNLVIHDLSTGDTRTLLDNRYQFIDILYTWSPDGQWLCFLGDLATGGFEFAAVNREGYEKGFKVLLHNSRDRTCLEVRSQVAWLGDSNEVVVTMQGDGDSNRRLYVLDVAGEKPPRLLPGIPANLICGDATCTPDGKTIYFAAEPPVDE